MPALFATFLLLALAFAAAVAFSSPRTRRWLKWLLLLVLVCAWASLAASVSRIVARTGSTLVTPGGARQPHLFEQAAREGLMIFVSLGLPALFATAVAWLALKATRPKT